MHLMHALCTYMHALYALHTENMYELSLGECMPCIKCMSALQWRHTSIACGFFAWIHALHVSKHTRLRTRELVSSHAVQRHASQTRLGARTRLSDALATHPLDDLVTRPLNALAQHNRIAELWQAEKCSTADA